LIAGIIFICHNLDTLKLIFVGYVTGCRKVKINFVKSYLMGFKALWRNMINEEKGINVSLQSRDVIYARPLTRLKTHTAFDALFRH